MTQYSISELATEFGVTTRTIRFYEEKGLLAPQRNGQVRIYDNHDRTKLKLIVRGKRLGFTLDESRSIIEMYDPAQGNVEQLHTLLEKIRSKRDSLRQQLQDIDVMLRDLDEAEQRCLESLNEH